MSPLTRAGLLIGLGFGALGETLVFGTLLNWHHVVCPSESCVGSTPQQTAGMAASDAILMLAACGMVMLGVVSLFEAARRSGSVWSYKVLMGGLLCGVGVYGMGEGLLAHSMLRVHHVVWNRLPWLGDGIYLAFGAIALLLGMSLLLVGKRDRERSYSIPEVRSRWYLG